MIKLQSRTGTVSSPPQNVYSFLSDFRNFTHLVPSEMLTDWKAEADSCSFRLSNLGMAGLRMVEREPFRLIKITGEGPHALAFFLWIQMKEAEPDATHIRLTLHADVPFLFSSMASGPLQKFLDMLLDKIVDFYSQQ
jgi:carbon monoxide dehydrogenase subunit G